MSETKRVVLNKLAHDIGIDPSGLRKVVKKEKIELQKFIVGKGGPALTVSASDALKILKMYSEMPKDRISLADAAKRLERDISGFCKTIKSKKIKTEEHVAKGVGRVKTISKEDLEDLIKSLPKRLN